MATATIDVCAQGSRCSAARSWWWAGGPTARASGPGRWARCSSATTRTSPDPAGSEPELVAGVGFGNWTDEGLLRHPVYLGLRHDKDPGDVVREPS